VTVVAGSVVFALVATDWGAFGVFWSGVIEGGVVAVAFVLFERKAGHGLRRGAPSTPTSDQAARALETEKSSESRPLAEGRDEAISRTEH
jgi:hypothetical protein